MNSLYQVDDLVKEYLLFRGFTATFRALETESRTDKDKGFQVDKILEELLFFVTSGDVNGLVEYYRYLDIRFFSRLDTRFQQTVKKFEHCLLRHYLVHAMQHKKRDKVKDFFEIYGSDLHGTSEWSPWFSLPYVKQPASDPIFETFFTKQWVDNYTTSLHNFLATIFQNMPLPSLLAFNVDRTQRKTQQTEIENLKSIVDNMKSSLEARENEIAKLKVELIDTRKEMTDGISLIRKRAASMTSPQQIKANGTKIDTKVSPTCTTTTLNPITATITNLSHDTSLDRNSNGDSVDALDEMNDLTGTDEPFVITSQEEFSEHASAITHAKFSTQGNLIASCDMDNIVRVWSYKGQSHSPQKLTNSTSNILSLEWDAKSDRFLFLGTDSGTIRVYNAENRAVVQEFSMTETYPWVTQLSSSPVEPVIVCSASGDKTKHHTKRHGALVAWSMKSMSSSGIFKLEPDDSCADINTIKHNHNGQMLVAGDGVGTMRIFDVRTMKSIVEWQTISKQPACIAQFSFDENSIYTVDFSGQLSQWSIHKPGTSLNDTNLKGFPPPPAWAPPASTRTSPHAMQPYPSISSPANSSLSGSALPPRPSSNRSTSSRASISSSRSARLSSAADDGVMQTILSSSPRSQMVAFSADTDYVLCATSLLTKSIPVVRSSSSSSSISSSTIPTSPSSSISLSSHSSSNPSRKIENNTSQDNGDNNNALGSMEETQGTIYQGRDGKPVLKFGQHHVYQKITTVDWTCASNACLLGSADGSVKVTNLIKTSY
ncbi:hypothetical protein BCR42DRAFT_401016 [Absidia repens]|uniref:Uncharacterized protein n=1 Tax=Absidia repens TaxID=90262 RepID=A0A1X2J1V7_9FUNG|nr:hypothetical protein BCR42DRAFT_401016 [Absidia repens]